MGEIKSEFYITLPSNSSKALFPKNNQSHFITRLSSPLYLDGDWEVGLSEVIIPRTYFNINEINNKYELIYEEEILMYEDYLKYEIPLTPLMENNNASFFENLNTNINIMTRSNCVTFISDNQNVTVRLWDNFEIHLDVIKSEKLLHILDLPIKDKMIKETSIFKYRNTKSNLIDQNFVIIDKRIKKEEKHLVPLTSMKQEESLFLFETINRNIHLLAKTEDIYFHVHKRKVKVNIPNQYEIHISSLNAPTLLKSLTLSMTDLVLDRNETFTYTKSDDPLSGEYFMLIKKLTKKIPTLIKKTEALEIPKGLYSTAEDLFKAFKVIKFFFLSNKLVQLSVPESSSVHFGNGLKDLLGFKINYFTNGDFIGDYPLELHAGITEIFIYTNIIQSHHVGEINAPLLRIIPLSGEKDEQIVKVYNNPIYFPLTKNFIETIEIELRASNGSKVTFASGKTILVLSFRKK